MSRHLGDGLETNLNCRQVLRTGVLGSAHVMGGCMMGDDEKHAVIDSQGQYHQLENLSIIDGSVFPTSIGANPQLSIYGLACKQANGLVEHLGGIVTA